jgi:outer membrane receptor protein involved in Fe transport
MRSCPAPTSSLPIRARTASRYAWLGNNPANDALESSVGVYLDDVYLGRPGMANVDLIDIDQVALLRGPQGTLFGKNTAAGVLNITTLAPSFTPGAIVEASVGNYDYNQVRASATGPLLDDTLAARLTVSRTYREGYVDDVADGAQVRRRRSRRHPWPAAVESLTGPECPVHCRA